MNVGQAIRWCRIRRGASQIDIAKNARCSVSYLSMLENNKRDPTLSTITKIAAALHVPVGALFVLASDQAELGELINQLQKKFAALRLSQLQMTKILGGRMIEGSFIFPLQREFHG